MSELIRMSPQNTGAAAASIIFVATPFPATQGTPRSLTALSRSLTHPPALLLSLRSQLAGKVIIDATNPYYSGSGLPIAVRHLFAFHSAPRLLTAFSASLTSFFAS
jgi:predicted dinucleotide-binding enzyme